MIGTTLLPLLAAVLASSTAVLAPSTTPAVIASAVASTSASGETIGGTPTMVVIALGALFVAALLSLYLALRLYRGYRRGGTRGMFLLATGLVLLTTVPILLRLLLSNVPDVTPTEQEIVVTVSQLVGLFVIVGVIYGDY